MWVLAGFQNYVGNAGLPFPYNKEGEMRKINTPIRTYHMGKNGVRATSIQVTNYFTLVETVNNDTQKRGLYLIQPPTNKTSIEIIQKRISTWFEKILLPHFERGEVDINSVTPFEGRFKDYSDAYAYDQYDWFICVLSLRYMKDSHNPFSLEVY